MRAEDAEALDRLPFSLSIPELGLVIVHAGLVPQGECACMCVCVLVCLCACVYVCMCQMGRLLQ